MKKIIFSIATLAYGLINAQTIISDSDNLSPIVNENAVLELKSNSKGLLIPRLNNIQIDTLDGNETAADLTPGMMVYNTDTKKFLGWDGDRWQDLGYEGTLNISSPDVAGQLIFTEFMIDPSGVQDREGEWFEIYNLSNTDFNLKGCTLKSPTMSSTGYSFDINGDLIVPANDYISIGSNLDTASNSGATVDYSYGFGPSTSNFPLTNNSDDVLLICNTVTIDQVEYDNTFFTGNAAPVGSSIYLDPNAFNATDNDLGSNWLVSTTAYGNGDNNGTPSEANETAQIPNTSVEFTSATQTINENAGTVSIPVSIINQSSTQATTVTITFSGTATDGTDYNNGTENEQVQTQTITFPAGSSATQNVTFTLVDDLVEEPDETIILTLSNVSGGSGTATIGTNNILTITINANDSSAIGQNFDNITSWNFSPEASVPFNANGAGAENTPTNPNRFYGIIEMNTNTLLSNSPNMSGYVFGFQDLQGSGYGTPTLEYTTYTSDVATITNQSELSFDYNIIGFDSSDIFQYKVIFDSNDPNSFISLPKNASGSEIITIPSGTSTVQLIFKYKQNGGPDAAAIDNIILQ